MMAHLGDILVATLLILLNGFFVAAEFALVKVRSTQLEAHIARGNKSAEIAREALHNLDPYLSATQLGITLASLGLGWATKDLFNDLLAPSFQAIGLDTSLRGPLLAMGIDTSPSAALATAIGFIVISFLHIVVGEVAPKSLAVAKAESTSIAVAPPMRLFYRLFYPALIILNASSNWLLRRFNIEPVQGHSMAMTSDELRQIALESTQGGTISVGQGILLKNVFTFSDRIAREIMIPRQRVVGIDIDSDPNVLLASLLPHNETSSSQHRSHTRYPLFEGSLDNIVGILHLKDLMARLIDQRPLERHELRVLAREAHFVPETMSAQRLLRTFQRLRSHMAIVVDEHGSFMGLLTLEDTLEELVGEIQDEFDVEEPPIIELGDGLQVAGGVLLEDLLERLGASHLESESDTVSGFIMEQLGRIPEEGDVVRLQDQWLLEVLEVEQRRVEQLKVTTLNAPEPH